MQVKVLFLIAICLTFTSCSEKKKSSQENQTFSPSQQVLMDSENNSIPKELYTIPSVPGF